MAFLDSTEDIIDLYSQLRSSQADAQASVNQLTAELVTANSNLATFTAALDTEQVNIEALIP